MKFSFLMAAGALVCASLASCSSDPGFIGSWKSNASVDMTSQIPGASAARYVNGITFNEGADGADGKVMLSSDFDITKIVTSAPGAFYEVNVKGTATVAGTWSVDVDDVDDLLLAMDYNNVKVDIAPADVTVTGPMTKEFTKAQMDSISTSAAAACRMEAGIVIGADFARYAVIEDMEVSKDKKSIEFEIGRPETEIRMVRVGI